MIRGYYFPLGTSKVIAYRDIKGVTPIPLGIWTGSWRIWGTSNPGYWWHLDWSRPQKDTALLLDLGRPVRPVITPDNPTLVAAIIEERRLPGHRRSLAGPAHAPISGGRPFAPLPRGASGRAVDAPGPSSLESVWAASRIDGTAAASVGQFLQHVRRRLAEILTGEAHT